MRRSAAALILLTFFAARSHAQTEVSAHIRSGVQASDDFNAAATFGMKYFAVGDLPSALDQFAAAEAIQPNNPAVLYDSAVILFRLGRFAEAQTKIDTYLRVHPNGAELDRVKSLQLDLEFERMRQKKQQENQSYLELFNRARFNYGKGDFAGALALFEQAEAQRPTDAAVAFNQSIVYEAMGDYAKAVERLRQYLAVQSDASDKAAVDSRMFQLQSEIDDAQHMIVCAFCGAKLHKNTVWCPHCWHGPYDVASALRNTRPCAAGATATRTSLYAMNRVASNEDLPCNLKDPSWGEAIRYSRARQRAIEEQRKSEGWSYADGVLSSYRDAAGNEIRLVHANGALQQMYTSAGDALTFVGRKSGDAWLLDSEEFVVDGQKYRKRYTYDTTNRVSSESVQYQNNFACGHLVTTTGTYVYTGDRLSSVAFKGGYKGFDLEGQPQTDWQGTLTFTYDDKGRVTKQDFNVDSMTKTWGKRPDGYLRNVVESITPSMRVKKPLDITKSGDVCAVVGGRQVGNPIDLRGFTSISPDLPAVLPFGVVKVTTSYVYP